MSRSNPTENSTPNPAARWFEWNGEHGTVRYYDKDAKQQMDCGSDFRFMLLDQLGSVRGWHDESDSGIYSNEVKDTRQDALIVRSFKGGTIAEGLYKDIKDRVNAVGGKFVANCYIAFKLDSALTLGSLRFKGAALSAWMEFCKSNRTESYRKAVRIHGFTEGKKGRIIFRVPIFEMADVTEETNNAATALDVMLQDFLKGYLKRTTRDQVDNVAPHSEPQHDDVPPDEAYNSAPLTDDDIPF